MHRQTSNLINIYAQAFDNMSYSLNPAGSLLSHTSTSHYLPIHLYSYLYCASFSAVYNSKVEMQMHFVRAWND